jgi:hypothetical protein
MATRSRIAIENPDNTVTSIYCHFDGYLSNNGEILQNHYTDRDKVEELIALGDISFLRENVESTDNHNFNNPQEGVTVAYHRDRGKDFSQLQHKDVEDFFDDGLQYTQFAYLFTLDGQWLVSKGGPVVELEVALKDNDAI